MMTNQMTKVVDSSDSRESRGSGGSGDGNWVMGSGGGFTGGGELHMGTLTEKLERLSQAGALPHHSDHNRYPHPSPTPNPPHHSHANHPMLTDKDRKASIMSEYSEESGLTNTTPRDKNTPGDPPSPHTIHTLPQTYTPFVSPNYITPHITSYITSCITSYITSYINIISHVPKHTHLLKLSYRNILSKHYYGN